MKRFLLKALVVLVLLIVAVFLDKPMSTMSVTAQENIFLVGLFGIGVYEMSRLHRETLAALGRAEEKLDKLRAAK